MENRAFEFGKMVNFMTDMQSAMLEYADGKHENAIHIALKAIDNALCVYQAIVNDYPYTERQYYFARELRNMVEREHLKIEAEFEKQKVNEGD